MVTKWKLTKPLAECCWDWIRILKNPMKIPLFVNSYPMKISHKHLIHIPFISSWLVGYFGTSFGLGFRTWIFHPTLEHSYHNHSQQEMTFFSWTIPKIHQIDGYGYKMLEVSMQKWYSFHISFSRNFPCFFCHLRWPNSVSKGALVLVIVFVTAVVCYSRCLTCFERTSELALVELW